MTCHSKEIWKPINNFEHYKVSNKGRLKNKDGLIMKQFYKERGDAYITFSKNNKKSTHRVARIVAQTFLNPVKYKNEVNHIDGNPKNNCVSNLEWVSRLENIDHAMKLGLIDNGKAVRLYCPHSKTSRDFKSMASCSRYLKKSNGYVNERIRNNKNVLENGMILTVL